MFKFRVLIILLFLLQNVPTFSIENDEGREAGNGGDFSEPHIYKLIEKIMDNVRKIEFEEQALHERGKTSHYFDMGGFTGEPIFNMIKNRKIYVRITSLPLVDSFGAPRNAINFRPSEVTDEVIAKHHLPSFVKEKYVIIINKRDFFTAISKGYSLEQLICHEIMGLFDVNDYDYSLSGNYMKNKDNIRPWTSFFNHLDEHYFVTYQRKTHKSYMECVLYVLDRINKTVSFEGDVSFKTRTPFEIRKRRSFKRVDRPGQACHPVD